MSKYAPLTDHLRKQQFADVRMTFAEIERVIGGKLPPKAQLHRAWWSNNPSNNVMTKAWLDAGFRSEQVDMSGRRLVFRRTSQTKPVCQVSGVEEPMHPYQHAKTPIPLKDGKHPAIGSMKGMITVAPGVDLTDPVYSEDEWNDILKAMEEKWDRLLGAR